MAFNISEFSSSLNRLGTAKTNLFVVTITPPTRLTQLSSIIPARELTLRASAVQLPQIDINTKTVYTQSIGRSQRRAVGLQEFSVIPIKFLVDGDQRIVEYFHLWLQNIVNYNVGGPVGGSNASGLKSYQVAYKTDYVAPNIRIDVYSNNVDTISYTYELYNAYPVNTPGIGLDWNNTDALMELDIGFTFDGLNVSGLGGNIEPSTDVTGNEPSITNGRDEITIGPR